MSAKNTFLFRNDGFELIKGKISCRSSLCFAGACEIFDIPRDAKKVWFTISRIQNNYSVPIDVRDIYESSFSIHNPYTGIWQRGFLSQNNIRLLKAVFERAHRNVLHVHCCYE